MEHQHKTGQKPTMNAGMSQQPPFSICSPSISLIDGPSIVDLPINSMVDLSSSLC